MFTQPLAGARAIRVVACVVAPVVVLSLARRTRKASATNMAQARLKSA